MFAPGVVAPAGAQMKDDQAEIRYLLARRYILWGEVALEYDRTSTKTGDEAAVSRYGFNQDFRLNFKSYIFHPALVTYTAEVDWLHGSGDYSQGNAKTLALDMNFLRTRPLNFSIGARYTKDTDYTLNQQSLSINYTRPRRELILNSMRAASLYASMQQRANVKNNKQQPDDNSSDTDDDANNNSNNSNNNNSNNNNNKNNNKKGSNNSNNNNSNNTGNLNNQIKPEPRNFLDIILPLFSHLDVQRDVYKTDFGALRSTESYSSALRFSGKVPLSKTLTDYNLNFDYFNSKEKGTGATDKLRYDASFDFRTGFQDGATLRFETKYDVNDYGTDKFNNLYARSTYEGFFANKLWDYRLSAAYNRIAVEGANVKNSSDNGTSLMADAGSSKRFGRLQTVYRFGLRYESGGIGAANYGAFATATAGMPVNDKLHLSLHANADIGTRQRTLGLDLNSRYMLSRMASLMAAYTFAQSSGSFSSGNELIFGSRPANYTTHTFKAGFQYVKNNLSFDSTAQYTIYNGGNALSWDNSLNTNLFNKISLTFGASLTRQRGSVGEVGSVTDNWSLRRDNSSFQDNLNGTYIKLYNTIAASPRRNILLRVYSTYTKMLDGNKKATYTINPVVSWRLRKLYLNLEYLRTVDYSENIRVREDKILLKVSRPFWQ